METTDAGGTSPTLPREVADHVMQLLTHQVGIGATQIQRETIDLWLKLRDQAAGRDAVLRELPELASLRQRVLEFQAKLATTEMEARRKEIQLRVLAQRAVAEAYKKGFLDGRSHQPPTPIESALIDVAKEAACGAVRLIFKEIAK